MKYTTALLFAEAVMAARLTQHRRDQHKARAADRKLGTRPKMASEILESTLTNNTMTQYSQNWAGAALTSSDITTVTAVITVPSISSTGGSSEQCASAWVGIDGDTCETAILQTGIDFCIEGGSTSFDAWYEWYPDYSYDFSLTVSEGDTIKMTVTATSDTTGTAVIENQTTGKTVTENFSNVEGSLCRTDAEWIVEDFEQGSSLVAFADFGTITFSDATATAGGSTLSPDSGSILDIEQSGSMLTSCSASSEELTCKYV